MKKAYHLVILFVLTITMFGTPHAQPAQAADEHYSLRFYGHGAGDIDRVKIPIDPHVPADVSGDFTIEFWMKANAAHNTSGPCTPGGDNWINGNIIIDRDIYGAGDYGDYGISLYGGKIAFGVANSSTSQTICGDTSVADNAWHHIAVTRNQTTGAMQIFVDGALDASGTGPTGDISYRDGRTTSYPDSDPYLVFGAEKHDAGPSYPSYNGFLDEVRISNSVRYTAAFSRPAAPLAADANTVALYRFDEGPAGDCTGGILDVLGSSNGSCSFGGAAPAGPVYSTDVPPIYQPDLVITGYELRDGPYPTGDLISHVVPNQTFWIWMTVENRGGGNTGNFYVGVFLDDKPNYGPDHDSRGAPPSYPVTLTLGEVTDYQGYKTTTSNALDGAGCRYYDPSNLVNPTTTHVLIERGNYHPINLLPALAAGTSATVSVQIAYPAGDYPDPIYDSIRTGLPVGSYNIYLYVDPACNVEESDEGNNDYGINISIGFEEIFHSIAIEDGWVLESTSTSGKGGSLNRDAPILRVGDDASNRQYRAILSFNTASLPDNAVITKVTLRVKRAGITGANPFNTHGMLRVDVRKGAFSGNPALQLTDFQAAANQRNIGNIPKNLVNGWYVTIWTEGIFSHINKQGVTQLRLRFAKEDNNNSQADFLRLYSGNASMENRPQLIIEYYLE